MNLTDKHAITVDHLYLTPSLAWEEMITNENGYQDDEAMAHWDIATILKLRVEMTRIYLQQERGELIRFSETCSPEVAAMAYRILEQEEDDWINEVTIENCDLNIAGFIGTRDIPMMDDVGDYSVLLVPGTGRKRCYNFDFHFGERHMMLSSSVYDILSGTNALVTCVAEPGTGWRSKRLWNVMWEAERLTGRSDLDYFHAMPLKDLLQQAA